MSGNVTLPAYQGADPSISSQRITFNMNGAPILSFLGDEAYGSITLGMDYWFQNASYVDQFSTAPSTIKNFRIWNAVGAM